MKAVLGIDSATGTVAVAATQGGGVLHEAAHEPDAEGRPRTSALLLGEVEAAVAAAGDWEQVGLIAVGLGPGSFTGLRIGITTARALAQARQIPIAGVSTLAALSLGIRENESERTALAVIDARRGQAFAALYDADGEELWPPTVVFPDELAERVRGLKVAPMTAGDGSVRFRQELEAAGAVVAGPEDPLNRVSARHLCALGEQATPVPAEQVRPIYLREPDAEKWQREQKSR